MDAVDFLVSMRFREDTLESILTGSTSRSVDSIDDDSTADADKPFLDSQCPDDVPDYTRYIRAQPKTEIVALLKILTTTRARCEVERAIQCAIFRSMVTTWSFAMFASSTQFLVDVPSVLRHDIGISVTEHGVAPCLA